MRLSTAKVICAFPGMGKSYFYKKYKDSGITILDSDSSNFSWVWNITHTRKSNIRNLDFPQNYINHIKDNLDKADVIFVSSHKEVRELLIEEKIEFDVVYPKVSRKKEMLELYRDRGNNPEFIEILEKNFDDWIFEIVASESEYQHKFALTENTFIENLYKDEFNKRFKLHIE